MKDEKMWNETKEKRARQSAKVRKAADRERQASALTSTEKEKWS